MRKLRNPFPDCENVEAIAAGVAADPASPTGEWFVTLGSVWRSDAPIVALCPQWFTPLGTAQTVPPFRPDWAA